MEQFVTKQIVVAAGKQSTLRDSLRTKIIKEQQAQNEEKLEALRKEIVKMLGTKILSVSEAGKTDVADLKVVVDSLRTQSNAMFGNDNPSKGAPNKAKKGGKVSRSTQGLVESRFGELDSVLSNLAKEQKGFSVEIRSLVTKLQTEMNNILQDQKAAVSTRKAPTSSSTIADSKQVKAIQKEIAQVSTRLDALGKSHAVNNKKEFASVKKTIDSIQQTMKQLKSSTDSSTNDAKETSRTSETNIKALRKDLHKQTSEANNEIQRVSKEMNKQNTKTLDQLQQLKKELQASIEALRKEASTSATVTVAKLAAATSSAAASAVSAKTDRRLGDADRTMINNMIKASVDTALKEYKRAEKAAQVPTRRGGKVDGKITQQMIMEWIDTAVETFAADRTGRVDYAVQTSGARIVGMNNPQLTSETYMNPNSTLSRKAARALGLAMFHGPDEVIKPTNGIGRYVLRLYCNLLSMDSFH